MLRKLFFLCAILLVCLDSSAQFNHPGRGMYVNKFFRATVNSAGAEIVDPNLSLLGIPAKENTLLQYAKDNHITYLILYDMHRVLGNSTWEGYLCSFIEKAKTQYCIEYIGVPSSCASMFDEVIEISAAPAFKFNDKHDDAFRNKMKIVEETYKPGDSLFLVSEVAKLGMNTSSFNNGCAYKLDVLVTEYEFWSSSVDDCVGDSPSRDVKYERYQDMIEYMDVIRDNYNSTSSGHRLYVETYLGYLHLNTNYSAQNIADWIDGSYSGKRRVDRILPHYYGGDAAKLYSRTSANGWNYSGYYLNRFFNFNQATTNNQTNIHPMFSSEYTYWGAGSSYLGPWFAQSVNNNIFTAEKLWYDDWKDDATNYATTTVGSPALGSVIHPGGAHWFTSFQMVGHLSNPVMFTSNSPVCVASGQNGTLSFKYQGPIEQGVSFKFYLTNSGGTTLKCGTMNSHSWPSYTWGIPVGSIDLNAALGSCSLPVGDYDAHLELTYSNGCSTYIAPVVPVSVTTSGKIVALTPTTTCQGNAVYLQASTPSTGTTTYQWSVGSSTISGATSSTYGVPQTSAGTFNYKCKITSSISGCSVSNSNIIPVTINAYPVPSISVQSSTACTQTLRASPGSASYSWQDGSTSRDFVAMHSGTYSVAVTVNGCTGTSSASYSKVTIKKVSQTTACTGISNGSVIVSISSGSSGYSLVWTGPVSGSQTGLSSGNKTISNLPAGVYSITVTDANGCSRTLYPSVTIAGIPPVTYYRDADNDTYGSSVVTTSSCTQPAGYVTNNSDCNDANTAINPGILTDICNGLDDNCNSVTDENCSVGLNLKLYFQGYYKGSGKMRMPLNAAANLCDSIKVELHEGNSPYSLKYSKQGILDGDGNGVFTFAGLIYNQNYFIVVRHRNSLETWSKTAVPFNSLTINYDFSNGINKAYGDNLKNFNDGKFGVYSGDITNGSSTGTQNGIVDINDLSEIESSLNLFITGYNIYDLTGDNIVETEDYSLIESNYSSGISISRP